MKKPISKRPQVIALDTETTGVHLRHGCKPFYISTCNDRGIIRSWQWEVNPYTREPLPPKKDIQEIKRLIKSLTAKGNQLVLHNTKFDVRALHTVRGLAMGHRVRDMGWWEQVHDTLIASHCLESGESHKLKDLAIRFLDFPDDDQSELRDAVNDARRIGRKLGFRIANKQDDHFPHQVRSPKDGWWVMDMWLPRAVCQYAKTVGPGKSIPGGSWAKVYQDPGHPWWSVCQRYADSDAERTIGLWLIFREALKTEGLRDQYERRRRMLPTTYRMESTGITISDERLGEQRDRFNERWETNRTVAINLADRRIDNLNSPKQLQAALYDVFRLKPIKETKTGYSVADDTLEALSKDIKPASKPAAFIRNLRDYRSFKKASEYIESYYLARLPITGKDFPPKVRRDTIPFNTGYSVLFPSFNITGTATTRFSSNNPNAQNISKQKKTNIRYVFGPLPGRIWYAMDYENIELRIFAYESGDQQLIDAFEKGGSVHLIVCKVLHPKLYAECERDGVSFKERYESTWYQWVKNGNFALIYGAGIQKANQTYRVPGAYNIIRKRLPLIDRFMKSKNREAKKYGYVTTLGGYRLQVPDDKPHVAVNYFVQGTAGDCMVLAMNRIDEYLRTLGDQYQMVMTIHDELVFDFPVDGPHNNEQVISNVRGIMEDSGDVIGLPTPAGVDEIRTNWADKRSIAV